MSRQLRRSITFGSLLLVAGAFVDGIDWDFGRAVVILLTGILVGYVLWRVPFEEPDPVEKFEAMRRALGPETER